MIKLFARHKKAFTLIEVMVVIAIIGILTSILAANYNEARKNSRDKIRQSDLKSIQLAMEIYKAQNDAYPTKLSSLVPGYLPQAPFDPSEADRSGGYDLNSNGSSYKIMTTSVESLYVTSFGDEFARCPSVDSTNCPDIETIRSTYAIYSAGAETW